MCVIYRFLYVMCIHSGDVQRAHPSSGVLKPAPTGSHELTVQSCPNSTFSDVTVVA